MKTKQLPRPSCLVLQCIWCCTACIGSRTPEMGTIVNLKQLPRCQSYGLLLGFTGVALLALGLDCV